LGCLRSPWWADFDGTLIALENRANRLKRSDGNGCGTHRIENSVYPTATVTAGRGQEISGNHCELKPQQPEAPTASGCSFYGTGLSEMIAI